MASPQPAASLDDLRRRLGERYAIERELGRGGMDAVYLARAALLAFDDDLDSRNWAARGIVDDAAVQRRLGRNGPNRTQQQA
jgi:hypothetical protein